jgi:16S rRNA (cytosine1402-N4)-methyltransferase
MNQNVFHIPVMVDEVIRYLITKEDGIYIDGTIGGGGHSEEILKRTKCKVIGFDIDPEAIKFAQERLKPFGERVIILRRNYAQVKEALAELGVSKVSGFLLDLGVSSFQLDYGGGGFSFRFDEKLDMRMDRTSDLTAERILNEFSEEDIALIIRFFGEERRARMIARELVRYRQRKKIERTSELVKLIDRVVSRKYRLKTLARVFQALRIAVNKELDNLKVALDSSVDILEKGGRIIVISYHSLEDRIVKSFFKSNEKIRNLTKKPVTPKEEEIRLNPRSRSAKLRAGEKITE